MKIALLLPLAASSLVSLASCRAAEPAAPPAPIDIARSDASRAEPADASMEGASMEGASDAAPSGSHATSDAAPSGSRTTSTTRSADAPPTGMYAITMRDRSNTCADAGAPSSASPPLVVATKPTSDGKWAANLPVNTGVGSPAIDRHDVVLEAP